MIKKLRGVVHGRTVELEEDPGIPEGQQVDVELEVIAAAATVEKKGLLRLEGVLTDCPEWDEIMEEIYLERKGIYRQQPQSK